MAMRPPSRTICCSEGTVTRMGDILAHPSRGGGRAAATAPRKRRSEGATTAPAPLRSFAGAAATPAHPARVQRAGRRLALDARRDARGYSWQTRRWSASRNQPRFSGSEAGASSALGDAEEFAGTAHAADALEQQIQVLGVGDEVEVLAVYDEQRRAGVGVEEPGVG